MLQGNIMFKEDEKNWIIDVRERITGVPTSNCMTGSGYSGVTINRVPKFLLFLRKEAYTPRVVHLGLYHHLIAQPVSHTERLKAEATERMARRLPEQEEHLHLDEAVARIVCEIRGCYEEQSEYKDETVATIFTLDGCFILEILKVLGARQQRQQQREEQHHPIFNSNRVKSCQFDVLSDFLMLENQIPLMVLIKLLEMEIGSEAEAKKELLRLLCTSIILVTHPFLPNWLNRPIEERLKGFEDLEKYQHILGLFQSLAVEDPRDPEETGPNEPNKFRLAIQCFFLKLIIRHKRTSRHHQTLVACARDLQIAGMKFRNYYGVPSHGKMAFERSTLLLSTIWITDSTEVILRNLMALEVCQGFTVISYYAYLLNSLVESEADAALLRRAEIIQSSMGTDKEVAGMLNNLGKGINFDSSDDPFMNLKVEINQWYRSNLLVQIREYKYKHPRLWSNMSILWGLVVLVSAVIPSLVSIWKTIWPHLFNSASKR
ncbi:hypothetical protein SUGI_1089900 [Cryptomeria japonica]|uniref:putative UPF0481 protein At3g02645 n=1 Tax=Cryptomeria japonica TaxID=3369 RepID=UPI002414B353|nr:putative UPF0481 protein At3g02645 [Cryptomeria japonica]GLJ51232.1 hypothetical protein SUGI_1089900 [Cryptomeria japonica]